MRFKTLNPFFYVFLFVIHINEATPEWHSAKCKDKLETYWDGGDRRCVPCEDLLSILAGHQFTPNCGRMDDGGQSVSAYEECKKFTFNDGTFTQCKPCTQCSEGQQTLSLCNATKDTQCCGKGELVIHGQCQYPETTVNLISYKKMGVHKWWVVWTQTTYPTTVQTKSRSDPFPPTNTSHYHIAYAQDDSPCPSRSSALPVFSGIAAIILLIGVCVLLICKLRKGERDFEMIEEQPKGLCCNISIKDLLPQSSTETQTVNENVTLLPSQSCKSLDDILALGIQKAPVQSVLDNLDILEELIMLLDPETSVAKTTRHVATRCSFSSTWINYAYSMRESKSPLKAVLEGVTTKFPEWTVGDLARVFTDIGRNDAVAVLAKLPATRSLETKQERVLE
ncbi:IGF-like family receptor 1 [Megalops cyprinoides]|uniref:IGF-like family receptor 1 n=1 Tax=Megalops cyprinoides TaxID=118141 RepID=UPI0018647781|nr:IGF-like family receptor 1 [Megalops cyprinoides]